MDGTAGQVPAPRAAASVSSPAGVPGAGPRRAPQDLARVPELAALLGEIDTLRTVLETDLSLAAAALEAGAEDLAGALVDGDRAELRAFSARAARHLSALDDAAQVVPVLPRRRRRGRLLQAAPLVAAAAALLGFVAGVAPEPAATRQPATTLTSAAQASYELNRLASLGAPDEALRRAAQELNDELSELVAQASGDPAAAAQALALLASTDDVLSRSDDTGLLRGVLAEARALRARLRGALPAGTGPVAPHAASGLTLRERREAEPAGRTASRPAPGSTSDGSSTEQPATPASPAPTAAPSPTPDPRPAPTTDPTAEPTAEPTPEPAFLQPGFDL